MNPDLGPYCLQLQPTKVHKQMREQRTIDVNGGLKCCLLKMCAAYNQINPRLLLIIMDANTI